MKITVVTISYNQAPHLQACIDSVSCQNGEWEHIVVDPGSSDGSREIIEKNRAHFSEIILEPDLGPADGLNKGFALASGTHGYFLNSDDFILPGAFDAVLEQHRACPDHDVYLFGGWLVDEAGGPVREIKPMKTNLASLLDGTSIMFQQGLVFSMETFRKTGGFNPDNRTCWDFELLCDLVNQGTHPLITPARIGAFRVYPGTISDNLHQGEYSTKYINEKKRLLDKYSNLKLGSGSMKSKLHASLVKYVRNPALLVDKAEHLFAPGTMARKWQSDHQEQNKKRPNRKSKMA
ncbi:MAG: glycosyltransferase [Rhizobiaceae bacterium]